MESLLSKPETQSRQLISPIKAMYEQETSKSVQIRINGGIKLWIPKKHIASQYSSDITTEQNFIIENYILKKVGYRFDLNG